MTLTPGYTVTSVYALTPLSVHRSDLLMETNRRPSSAVDSLIMEDQRRRLSEAGVNRRPSAAHVLTEDTDSFIIGQRVYVDGVKPGRIQFIGMSVGENVGKYVQDSKIKIKLSILHNYKC